VIAWPTWIGATVTSTLDSASVSAAGLRLFMKGQATAAAPTVGAERQLIVKTRLLLAAAMWGAALLALVIRRFQKRLDAAYVALIFGPFAAVAAQPYGGELLLRVALFTTPMCVVLIATVLIDTALPAPRVVVGVILSVIMPVFVLARFGNESYESVLTEDLELTGYLYEVAPERAVVYLANPHTLSNIDRVGRVTFEGLAIDVGVATLMDQLTARAGEVDAVYILFTTAQALYGTEVNGRAEGWLGRYADALIEQDAVIVVRRDGPNNVLLQVEPREP